MMPPSSTTCQPPAPSIPGFVETTSQPLIVPATGEE
jgi:hypothetical protein